MTNNELPNYKIISKGMRGNFEVLDAQDHAIVALEYEDWFSSKGTARIGSDLFSIKSRNIWWTNFDIFHNSEDIGDLTINWKGHVIIKMQEPNQLEKVFVLKTTGFWNYHFVLEDGDGQQILVLKPTLKWSKMSYDYAIYLHDASNMGISTERLLLLSGYSANLIMMMMMTTVAVA